MRPQKMTAALLAFAACIAGTVALAEPPPYFSWAGSPWTARWEIKRQFIGGVAWEPVKLPKRFYPCNGSSTDPKTGKVVSSCGFRLSNPSDLDYLYEVREYAEDGTLVRVTGCRPIGECWVCEGATKTRGDVESFEVKSPYNCKTEGDAP